MRACLQCVMHWESRGAGAKLGHINAHHKFVHITIEVPNTAQLFFGLGTRRSDRNNVPSYKI